MPTKTHRIAVIAGDGIGPEVIAQGLRVLEAVAPRHGIRYEAVEYPFSTDRWLATGGERGGETLPDSAFAEIRDGADAVLLGAHGGVCGGANLAPRLYVDIYEAATAGDVSRALALQERVWAISRNFYQLGIQHGSWLKGLKCAVASLGICDDTLCEPFQPLGAAERQLVKQRLKEMNLLAANAQHLAVATSS